MNYICNTCGQEFDAPYVMREKHTELDECATEIYEVCPNCGGGEWEESRICCQCGVSIPYSQSKFGLCKKCEEKALNHFREFMDRSFTKNEREFLNWKYEGAEI